MNTVGERIRQARLNAGLTQAALAEKLNVTYQAISSWENDIYVPDTWNLIELAKVLEVSVSSLVESRKNYHFKTNKSIYDVNHMASFIRTTAYNFKFENTLKALDFAIKAHEGQKRKKSDIPYIYHPLNIACHMLAMDIKDDEIISACLLHDVIEDCGVKKQELPVNDRVKELVVLMSHPKTTPANREEIMNDYFEHLSKDPDAALIKCVDRCNNLTTMSWGLSRDRIYRQIEETEKYVIPLLKNVVKKEMKYYNAAWLLSYQIESTLDIYKRLL